MEIRKLWVCLKVFLFFNFLKLVLKTSLKSASKNKRIKKNLFGNFTLKIVLKRISDDN